MQQQQLCFRLALIANNERTQPALLLADRALLRTRPSQLLRRATSIAIYEAVNVWWQNRIALH